MQHFAEGAEAVGGEATRREGGESPVLALTLQKIGGRADGEAEQGFALAAPALAAAGIGADGKVADDADAHAGVAAGLLGRRELLVDAVLQPQVEGDGFRILRGEITHLEARWVLEGGRPAAPVPMRQVLAEKVGVQRFENGVRAQARAVGGDELCQCVALGGIGLGSFEDFPQLRQAKARGGGPVDKRMGFERKIAGGDAAMQNIQRGAARRCVWAETIEIGAELGMHGGNGDGVRAERRRGRCEFGQGTKIADATVVFSAQRIELNRETPAFCGGRGFGHG